MPEGRSGTPLTTADMEDLPGSGSVKQEIYEIVPGSVTIIEPPTKRDKRGCLMAEPPAKEMKLDIRLPGNQTRTISVQWPTQGVSHVRTHPASYHIVHTHNAGDENSYNIEPKPGATPAQAIASRQHLNPFRRRGVTAKGELGIDVFGELSSRLQRLQRKVAAARVNAPLNKDIDDTKLTKVGDSGSTILIKNHDLHGEDEGDPVAVDNPLDRGVARMEIAIGDAFSIVGDHTGFKNVSKIIKNAIDPHSMQWSDWLVNPLTKFLPSTAVVPLKTWMRAIVPSAMMLGMITLMKHALKDIQAQLPPQPTSRVGILRNGGSRTTLYGNPPVQQQASVGGVLGAIENVENTIRG